MAATGGHYLQQQKPRCEAAIKNCINSDLKEICKAYNYQVSGTKAVLQKRCFESKDTTEPLASGGLVKTHNNK